MSFSSITVSYGSAENKVNEAKRNSLLYRKLFIFHCLISCIVAIAELSAVS